jgi:hypothetical protein
MVNERGHSLLFGPFLHPTFINRNLFIVINQSATQAKVHFGDKCNRIPQRTKDKLLSLQQINKRASGGKQYWVDGLKAHGVYEDPGKGLRFRPLELGSGGF